MTGRSYYDDNFGHWEMGEGEDYADNVDFYNQVQRESVIKKCGRCGRKVKLRPDYAYCNPCADAIERGAD